MRHIQIGTCQETVVERGDYPPERIKAILGGETLTELRQSLTIAESEVLGGASPRVAPFVDVRALGSLAQRAGLALPVVDLGLTASAAPGRPDHTSAPAAIASIDTSVGHVLDGFAEAVVTNPIAKNVLYRSGFSEPGHTEYLAKLAARATGTALRPVMMLWSPELAVVPVTIHLPLKEIFKQLSTELVVETGRIVARDLARRFELRHPRLVIAGLNPHAGEAGTLGEEDEMIVAPAVARLAAEGIDVKGPVPADSMFHERARATYDAALCMYHDQALIPIKTLAFDHAVNVTLGLPFVRTSPDHGTAFDISGTGTADPASLIAALRLAKRLATAPGAERLPAS